MAQNVDDVVEEMEFQPIKTVSAVWGEQSPNKVLECNDGGPEKVKIVCEQSSAYTATP